MHKLFTSIILFVTVVIISHFFVSCANIGTITGGKKDSIPPVMVGSRPVLLDTNFKDKKVFILFNEFVVLKDVSQQFYSSPPFKEMPDFKVKKRSLLIKFKEPLKDSVTYTLNFANSVADNNEGNILKNFRFVFSTKSIIDSFSIAGTLRNAKDQSAPEKSIVEIYENHQDSIPFKSLPNYEGRTDSTGNFSIDFIRPGSYKLFVVNDKNSNQLADFYEARAFLDSFIVPQRSVIVNKNLIKAGTVLHDTINGITDSLVNDTMIISRKFITYPANLRLYLFTENNLAQKVLDYNRKERAKINMNFVLPLTSDFKANPINFKIDPKDLIIEKNPTNDSITWWITDPQVKAMDSLQIGFTYMTKDSIGKPKVANDTIIFEYREKQNKEAWKRKSNKEEKVVKKEYLNLSFLVKDAKVDLDKGLRIESLTPLLDVDTSKIRLFEIVDTSVIDTKEQKILKAFRLQKDLLTFKFKRPIAQEFNLYPINFKAENWYTKTMSDSGRFYTCQITSPEVAMMDTIKLLADYDNNFFMKQIQVKSDTVLMPLSAQKIISRKRNEANKIMLAFNKPLSSNLVLNLSDLTTIPNWYQVTKNQGNDTATINLLDLNIINKDTLTFAVKCFDYINLKNDSVFFNETMRLTFKENEQFVVNASRPKKEKIVVSFNKRLIENPVLEPVGLNIAPPWYQLEKTVKGDSLIFNISNATISSKDTLNLLLKYTDTDRRGKISNYADTLTLQLKQTKQFKKRTDSGQQVKQADKPQTVHIYLPTDYKLAPDSIHLRQRILSKKWKEKTKYTLRLDSLSFKDVFNLGNKAQDYEFSSQPLDYYAKIILSLKNIKPLVQNTLKESLQDSTKRDSLSILRYNISQKEIDKCIGNGKLIVQLLGEKNVVIREYFVSKNQDVKLDYLAPGKYKIRIIFDKNENGVWDTGDYFNHIQPERVVMNGEEILLKSGFELQLDWNVGESLIKSFTKDPSNNY